LDEILQESLFIIMYNAEVVQRFDPAKLHFNNDETLNR
jgi:hypothetical protein